MRTPSIERRFVAFGTAVVAVLVLFLDLLVYFTLRADAMDEANKDFEAQASVVKAEASVLGAEGLSERLATIGIDATVIAPDGTLLRRAPAVPVSDGDTARTSREVVTDRGIRVILFTKAGAADARLTHVLVLEGVMTPLVLALALLLLRWVAELAAAPLDQIAERARRTTLGRSGERLLPDRPGTRLGKMATAYDAMLDALEGAVAEATSARAESDRLERRTRMILDSAHEAFIVMDDVGAIVDWNPEAERTFGWPRDEILGRVWQDVLIPPEVRQQMEADRPADRGSLWPSGTRATEMVAVRRDGTRFPAEVTVWATNHDGVCTFNALVRDFTERRRAEEAMGHLAAIVESSDRAMMSTDPVGNVLTWNPAAERMYGYSAAEAIGRHLTDLIIPTDLLDTFTEALANVSRGEVIQRAEVIRRRKDGSLFPVSVTIAPLLDAEGKIYGACSVARDTTEERLMASELLSTLKAREEAAQEARDSEARTRRFLDDAAHQLRSPITSIRACAETLSLDVTPEQHDRLLDAVCRESARAGRLMAGLLRMARLGHEGAAELEATDVVVLCEDVAERARLDRPNLAVSVRAIGPLPGEPVVPAQAVEEILSNLVDNAGRHARSQIDITAQAVLEGVELRVADDGPGLAEGMAGIVFERFVSLDHQGGSGLGLAIGRELARASGGDLTYERGAFVLRLPCTFVAPEGPDELADLLAHKPLLFETILERFGAAGGVELEIPSRSDPPRAAPFR